MTTTEVGFSQKMTLAVTVAEKAKAVVVTNAQEHAAAGELVEQVRGFEKELEAEYRAHPTVVEARKIQTVKGELAALLETARKTAKNRQMAWEDDQERIRRAEESRLAAEAKKRADDEALARAKEAQANARPEEAVAILEEAIQAPTPVVVLPKTAPKTSGRRMVPKFRITNEALIPRQYLSPDMVKIGGVIRSLRGSANIPGVEFYEEAA